MAAIAKHKHKKSPPFRVIVTAANIDPAEREIRINKALEILIDESLREAGRTRKARKHEAD